MKKIYNPTNENFSVKYDINGDGQSQTFTIHAGEIEAYEDIVADHIAKHLAHKITEKTKGKGSYEDAFDKAIKLITDMKDLAL
ncbi:MAG TPA: hypothetical protein VF941_11765 [Clostridia bacterium]